MARRIRGTAAAPKVANVSKPFEVIALKVAALPRWRHILKARKNITYCYFSSSAEKSGKRRDGTETTEAKKRKPKRVPHERGEKELRGEKKKGKTALHA